MAKWDSQIDVSKVWRKTKDGTIDTQTQSGFSEFISELKPIIESSVNFLNDRDFRILAKRVLISRSVNQFDEKWSNLYDYCDMNRIWIITF